MKRILLLFLSGLIFIQAVNANDSDNVVKNKNIFATTYKTCISKYQVKKVIRQQLKYSDKYDLKALSNLYDKEFIDADGFNKEIYFKLIDETWKIYPDITYKTKINNIIIDGDKAFVNVSESAVGTTSKTEKDVTVYGELNSYSSGTYFLTKIDNKWLFTGEKVDHEKSLLKYGDTRFVEMDLESPEIVKPGEWYTSSLTVDAPDNSFVIASIGKEMISNPQEKPEEVYRKLPADKILERMFTANSKGKNEYNVASVALSKARKDSFNNVNVYLAGVAFIMKRVNIDGVSSDK